MKDDTIKDENEKKKIGDGALEQVAGGAPMLHADLDGLPGGLSGGTVTDGNTPTGDGIIISGGVFISGGTSGESITSGGTIEKLKEAAVFRLPL